MSGKEKRDLVGRSLVRRCKESALSRLVALPLDLCSQLRHALSLLQHEPARRLDIAKVITTLINTSQENSR